MNDDQCTQARAQAQQDEAILGVGVWVVGEDRSVLIEDRLGFLERDAMFALIPGALSSISFEPKIRHRAECSYKVCTSKLAA